MRGGYGYTPAVITGQPFSAIVANNSWLLTRPGIFLVSMRASGGGGGGKNETYSTSAEAGTPGELLTGNYSLDRQGFTFSVATPGRGGNAGTGFDWGTPGIGSGVAIISNAYSGSTVRASGGNGGRASGYGSGTPSYNPVPVENGGWGGSVGTTWNRPHGGDGGPGFITLTRLS